jgi:hypothetical protein
MRRVCRGQLVNRDAKALRTERGPAQLARLAVPWALALKRGRAGTHAGVPELEFHLRTYCHGVSCVDLTPATHTGARPK